MHRHAIDNEFAFLDGLQAVDTTNQGTLARSTRTADHDDFSLVNLQIDVV
jgi:hypothetical protein